MKIGERLRQARLNQSLTIDEIAGISGLSRPYISQVETGKASPSIPSLEKLANALELRMSALFAEDEDTFTYKVFSKEDRQVLIFGSPDRPAHERKSIHFLSAPGRSIEFCMLELAPGYVAGGNDHQHEGEEVFYVQKGSITVQHGPDEFVLAQGEAAHVNATIVHQIINSGDETAEVLVSRTPPGFSDILINRSEGEA